MSLIPISLSNQKRTPTSSSITSVSHVHPHTLLSLPMLRLSSCPLIQSPKTPLILPSLLHHHFLPLGWISLISVRRVLFIPFLSGYHHFSSPLKLKKKKGSYSQSLMFFIPFSLESTPARILYLPFHWRQLSSRSFNIVKSKGFFFFFNPDLI